MAFTIQLFSDEVTPFAHQIPLQLLADGEVVATAVTATDGHVTFDCDVASDAVLAIRLDRDHDLWSSPESSEA